MAIRPTLPEKFEDYLREEFQSRRSRNTRYSLRAFSKKLGTDVSQLSKVICGKRPISSKAIAQYGKRLNLSEPVIERFKAIAELRKIFPTRSLTEFEEALNSIPVEWRDRSSITMATNSRKIEEAKKMITRFRRELCTFLEDTEDKDSVYTLGISLFPDLFLRDGEIRRARI